MKKADEIPTIKRDAADIELRMECLRLASHTRGTNNEILQTAKTFLDFVLNQAKAP